MKEEEEVDVEFGWLRLEKMLKKKAEVKGGGGYLWTFFC